MRKLVIALCILIGLSVLGGGAWLVYRHVRMKFILDDVGVIAPHLTRYGSGIIVFDAGPYRDGTAIVDSSGAAFWVKDGTGYVVNDATRQAAPDLPQAPEEIRFDAAFITAAEAG